MALDLIDFGSGPDTPSGDDLYTGGQKINANFTELDQRWVLVNGNVFGLRKLPGNVGLGLETGDAVVNGFFDSTEFWKLAIYQGGNQDLKTSYNIIESI